MSAVMADLQRVTDDLSPGVTVSAMPNADEAEDTTLYVSPPVEVKEAKRFEDMTFEDWQRGVRAVLERDHAGMNVTT